MTYEVFISYSKQDRPLTELVCEAIEKESIKCWMAPRNIIPGKSYPSAIVKAIKTSRIIVLILTKYSNISHLVMRELERAVSLNITIIPFKTENIDL